MIVPMSAEDIVQCLLLLPTILVSSDGPGVKRENALAYVRRRLVRTVNVIRVEMMLIACININLQVSFMSIAFISVFRYKYFTKIFLECHILLDKNMYLAHKRTILMNVKK